MKYTEKLDTLWSKLVKIRGGFKCEVCKKQDNQLNSHHIVGRTNRNLRWDLRNGVSLCVGCHKFRTQSAHEDPEWFRGWLMKNRGEDFDYVNQKKNTIKKWTNLEKKELLEDFKKQVKGYENNSDIS